MIKPLLNLFKKNLLALLFLPFVAAFLPMQVTGQSAGDVAFVGFNSDGPGDGFSVVLFTSYSASDEVHFSSQEWDGSTFAGTGGDFTWVAPVGGTTPGTVLVFTDVEATPSVNIGSITNDANMNLSGSGDIIYAYTGTDKNTPVNPFLGSIATDSDLYTQPDSTEGTLANTGLTQGTTAILLPNNIDNAEYIGDRSGNTPNGYQTLLNDIATEGATDDNWDIYNGGDVAPFPPFDNTSFTLVSPPTVAFTASTASVAEDGSSVTLTVELVESTGSSVSVEIAFLSGSSTADLVDIGNYTSPQTVSFTDIEPSATTKTVTITLTNDGTFEGTKTAVFQLQNNSIGSIIAPDVLTLTITDDDAPDVVINEILFDPNGTGGDANGDGTADDGSGDEFVEFVNNENVALDISNWVLADAVSDRYTFPEGTVIPANTAFVVFAAPAKGINFGGAYLYSAGSLGLNNGSDNVILKDGAGTTVVNHSYSSGGTDESITRDPDITGSFADHETADAGDDGSPFSPGTQIDGTAFGAATYAIGIRGSEGWRMVSSPTSSTTFDDLFSGLWTQDATGSDDPSGAATQYSWTETGGGSFSEIGNMSDPMTAGKGYIVYVFEDDEFDTPGIQGGFPKTISTSKAENSSPFSIPITATDDDDSDNLTGNEGWNLLGNPYGTDIKVDEILSAVRSAVQSRDAGYEINANVYIWDHTGDEYIDLAEGGDETVAPFQAFWVRIDTVETSTSFTVNPSFDRANLAANSGTDFFKQPNRTAFKFNLSLSDNNSSTDRFFIEFGDRGVVGYNNADAYKLFSLNPDAINLYALSGRRKLLKDVLPDNLNEIIEIPLAFDAPNRNKLTFTWGGISELPQYWDVTLIDRTLGRELNLRRDTEYKFSFQQPVQNKTVGRNAPLYKTTSTENADVRFVLHVNPGLAETGSNQNVPSSVQLNPNYPNPFNPTTTISYSLTKETQVKMTVWNIVGQKVATLVDGVVEAGTHTQLWNASDMPSGIYIAQMEVGGNVYIRKMTLIK